MLNIQRKVLKFQGCKTWSNEAVYICHRILVDKVLADKI